MTTREGRDLCVVGSANLDTSIAVPALPLAGETVVGERVALLAGGKGLNQAVAAARCGARTRLVASIGDDDAGGVLLRAAAEAGVAVDDVVVERGVPTGRAEVLLLPGGENAIVVSRGANRQLRAATAAAAASRAGVVLAQLEIPLAAAHAALRAGLAVGARTILNAAPASREALELARHASVVVVNQHEAEGLGGVATILGAGAGAVVVTLGAEGCVVVEAGRELTIPAFAVEPVDTTGAGDAFCGALAAGIARGLPLAAAAVEGAAAGAVTAASLGAQSAQLHRAAIDALVAERLPQPASSANA
jgi:ribokinase